MHASFYVALPLFLYLSLNFFLNFYKWRIKFTSETCKKNYRINFFDHEGHMWSLTHTVYVKKLLSLPEWLIGLVAPWSRLLFWIITFKFRVAQNYFFESQNRLQWTPTESKNTGGPHYIRKIGTPKIGSHIMNSHIKDQRSL